MMKGADAAMLAVCRAFKLETEARPVYFPRDDDMDTEAGDPVALFEVQIEGHKHLSGTKEDWIGDEFREMFADYYDRCYDDNPLSDLLRQEGLTKFQGIRWLNDPKHKDSNFAYLAV